MEELRTARRTQAERRGEARQRVLRAATALVALHGSRAMSLAAVGEAAGYSRGIVHHHFGSKAQLLEEVIKYTQTFDVPADSATGLSRLTDFVGAYLSGLHERSPRSEAFLKLWTESAGAEPSLGEIFAERDAQFREVLAQYIVDGIDDGSIRPEVDPQTAAVAIIGLLRGSALMAFSTARDVSAADLASVAVAGVDRSLAARD